MELLSTRSFEVENEVENSLRHPQKVVVHLGYFMMREMDSNPRSPRDTDDGFRLNSRARLLPRETQRACRLRFGAVFPSAHRFGPAVSRGAAAHRRRYHAVDMLAELAGDPELRLDMNLMPGDIQLLRNHTILYARSAYEDWPEIERKRHP
jgi:hypothetical protein